MKMYTDSKEFKDFMDRICIHCGQRYGLHHIMKDTCPDPNDHYRTHNTNTTFEPKD